ARAGRELHLFSVEILTLRCERWQDVVLLPRTVVQVHLLHALPRSIELSLITDVLPPASSAGGEVEAPQIDAEVAGLGQLEYPAFSKRLLCAIDTHLYQVARHTTVHEEHLPIHPDERTPLVFKFLDANVEDFTLLQTSHILSSYCRSIAGTSG